MQLLIAKDIMRIPLKTSPVSRHRKWIIQRNKNIHKLVKISIGRDWTRGGAFSPECDQQGHQDDQQHSQADGQQGWVPSGALGGKHIEGGLGCSTDLPEASGLGNALQWPKSRVYLEESGFLLQLLSLPSMSSLIVARLSIICLRYFILESDFADSMLSFETVVFYWKNVT